MRSDKTWAKHRVLHRYRSYMTSRCELSGKLLVFLHMTSRCELSGKRIAFLHMTSHCELSGKISLLLYT